MIACLQPSTQFFEENYSTLQYAARAALVKNQPVRNDDPLTRKILELKVNIRQLKAELVGANAFIENLCVKYSEPIQRFGEGLLEEG